MAKKNGIKPLAAGRIQLSRIDFLELEVRHGLVQQELVEARARVEEAQRVSTERIQAAENHRKELLGQLATKYRFDPAVLYKSCLKRSLLIQVDANGNELGK